MGTLFESGENREAGVPLPDRLRPRDFDELHG